MTELQQLYADWQDCTRCHLSDGRKNVVMLRGDVPCDVLLVAESPAHSEDKIGVPLIGPAGHILDEILAEAIPEGVTFAVCNCVGCISLDDTGRKVHKPDDTAVQKCSPRLVEIVRVCDPKLIVCLGDVAQHYLMTGKYVKIDLGREIPMVAVCHPSAIGQAKYVQQGLMRQKAVVQIQNAIEDHVLGEGKVDPIPF